MKYTYKDFQAGKIHTTSGKFKGWTDRTGLLNVRYAIFQRPKSSLFVPEYCLTKETRQIIEANPNVLPAHSKIVCQQIITGNID